MANSEKLTSITFFISSTFEDLKEYRNAVIGKIEQSAGIINAQEFFGSRSKSPLETCMEELDKSDVVILIVAHRYGSIDNDTKKSFTELEYDQAREKGKIILAYLIDETHPWNPTLIDSSSKKVEKFKQIIRRDLTINSFTTPQDLAEKVFQDLLRELPKNGFNIGEHNLNRPINQLKLLKQICEMPRLMGGREIVLTVQMDKKWKGIKEEHICDALDLTHGSSICRKFKSINKDENDILIGIRFDSLYAEHELAIELCEIPPNQEVKIRMRMKYGTYQKPIHSQEAVEYPSLINYFQELRIINKSEHEYRNYFGFIFCGVES